MDCRLEYEVNARLIGSAQQLAIRLARVKLDWRHRAGFGLLWLMLALWMAFFLDLTTILLIGLAVFLCICVQAFYRYMLLGRSVAHCQRITLILDDSGLCLRSAISESRYAWREVRDLLPQRDWLAIVMTPVPMVIPIPDSAFADDAARQAFLEALRAGMREAEDRRRETEDGGQAEPAPPPVGLRQTGVDTRADRRRMLCFRALHAEALAPDVHHYRLLIGLALFGLFSLGAQMAQHGLFDSENAGLRLLLLAVAYAALLLCAARVLDGAAADTMRLPYALCLLLFCLPWIVTGNQSAGLAELWIALGLTEAKLGISPYHVQALTIWLVIFWLIAACTFPFRHARREARMLYRVMLLSVFVFIGMSIILAYSHAPESRYAPSDGETPTYIEVDEQVLYGQSRLLAESLAAVRAGVKGKPELFFLGMGGEGQDVFLRETQLAKAIVDDLFATGGHSMILVNHASTARIYPMANAESLRQAVRRMGEQMNGAEDVLFLFLTTHGSSDFRLSLAFWPFSFADISPQMLRQALDEAGIARRVVVISACYSGGFIPALQDDNTLVITSAAADRTSFGCSDEDELTEFGRAYFAESLRQTRSIETAFAQAAARIAAEEKAVGRDASLPQIAGGNAALRAQLASFGTSQTNK
ncbi:MAG: C13 family peptidase [Zoogloeaceae bacterium]|jgi:hypothetical protein|nr:C13 family peptidase [Zoogloeaceae bacterium]